MDGADSTAHQNQTSTKDPESRCRGSHRNQKKKIKTNRKSAKDLDSVTRCRMAAST